MAFLKKSLFLVLFLGIVSLATCQDEKRQDDDQEEEENEEGYEENREKRFFFDTLKNLAGKVIGALTG
uniref:Phenylseptin prepropeptide n=1 Tax=Boana punctata TaxID=2499473 RepID=A0A0U1U1Y3_BOAPU|nr:phenylseptin prepropeptide [Boana punctata]